MQSTNDIQYIRTKEVILGKRKLDDNQLKLAAWIKNKYGLPVLNIEFDTIDQGKRGRVNIIVPTYKDTDRMHHSGPDYFGYKREFQEEILQEYFRLYGKQSAFLGKLLGKNIKPWVCYHAFNPIAMAEANEKIGIDKIKELVSKYSGLGIWQIVQFFEATVVFFHTDEQVTENRETGKYKPLQNELYDAIKQHDEFNLIRPENFVVGLSSKETIDKKFEGSVYNYFR